ncbi:hypothetical protein [Acidaminobacter sp. JC074]|uniref:hypothetical protein n=1 Tax=Acidaminobacter sp. JC074 TaxID=2530199 RepID=UPI001F0E8E44|nr:hypothetical protein [Acidaminobacter sp. JC074]
MERMFDLNIETILENWTVSDALREIISNALDEQALTNTEDIKISKDMLGNWHIRDFGRGLEYNHFTQNENEEKLSHPNLIGKFGVGLKDALATFDRNNIGVRIKSKHGDISLTKMTKHDFEDITTLHASIMCNEDIDFKGTEFILSDIDDSDVEKAKQLFIKFSNSNVLDVTKYGEVLEKGSETAYVYINGLKVAEEDNFQFSYNITNVDKKIKRALNRERSNVGRSAYSDRVKSILLSSSTDEVAQSIAENLKEYTSGNLFDEVKWIDVQVHAIKILNTKGKTLFISSDKVMTKPELLDDAESEGYKIVVVPNNLYEKICDITDLNGDRITNTERFYDIYNESFEFEFIKTSALNKSEMKVYQYKSDIIRMFGGMPRNVKRIEISQNMRKDYSVSSEINGLWIPDQNMIVIKRKQLKSLELFSGTLMHELVHAKTGTSDVSRGFENHLTELIGKLCNETLEKKRRKKFFGLF